MASRFRYFVAVSPGLESLLVDEFRRLGIDGTVTPGGLECRGEMRVLWAIVHRSRLAESVRLRLRPFRATGFAELERGLERLPWHAYLKPESAFTISTTCHASRLYHTQAIAERLKRVIEAKWANGRPPTPSSVCPAQSTAAAPVTQKLYVRVSHDTVQISIDASGERLHRRGYRTHVGDAPLRETLAAATIQLLVALAPERQLTALWDPCCGSGTLLGEWLLLPSIAHFATGRSFAFEQWPIHDHAAYTTWLEETRRTDASNPSYQAFGSDSNARVLKAARHNLELAGVAHQCALFAQDFHDTAPHIPKNTAVVANLPYGVRLQDRAAASQVFLNLDRLLLKRTDLRPALVLTTLTAMNDPAKRWRKVAEFANGGLRVTALALAEPAKH